jgi:RHS repeat-associated protein
VRYQATVGYLRYHSDMHGNVTALLDYGGTVIEKYTYDAFGRPTVTNGDGTGTRGSSNYGNRFMFTGREYFSELGLYDYRHRFYDPWLGRFLQTDPIGFDAGDMNLFRYCDDDPVDRSDPTGLVERDVNSTIWNRLRIFDTSSSSQESLSDQNETLNRSYMGSDLTMAGQYRNEGHAASRSSDEAAIQKGRPILVQQTKEGEDSTAAFVGGKPVPGDHIRGQQVPYRFARPVYKNPSAPASLKRVDHMEEPVPPGRSDLLTHYHSRKGVFAQPTDIDMRTLKTTGAMLFCNPYLKAEGAYRIYRYGVPRYETRYDLYHP